MNGRIRCRNCGCKRDDHRGNDGKCPPIATYGVPKPFPTYAIRVRNEAAAQAKFARDVDRYWARSRSAFEPDDAYREGQAFLNDLRLGR